jgi:hypothetical protein
MTLTSYTYSKHVHLYQDPTVVVSWWTSKDIYCIYIVYIVSGIGTVSCFLLICYSPYHSRLIQNGTLLDGNGK